ncbi:branched-chain amino acid transport system II carrier protein [Actinomyces bowdenii]|uniref:branched-chain amino acid transport system II carrier protein n=1 Tax=Actinomyces bowdenii TaxID=131109 RepID=UPI00214C33A8|nr:branched-chain amino acid transport system II carrier protein [Actinomyces bowdenii]
MTHPSIHRTVPSSRPAAGALSAVTTGLMLFALFFGAGNLIFPPVLGASAGSGLPAVLAGFLTTGVLMPLVAIMAVSTSGEGILGLARRVGPRFGVLMPLAVYLSIGPLYAVPRVATVAYELATRPVLELMGLRPGGWALALHIVVFFSLALLIAMRPGRMADSIGRWLTPALLALLAVLCGAVLLTATGVPRPAEGPYARAPLGTGLTQGYLTMDVLAATVFGIVVITSLRQRGITQPRQILRATCLAGIIAATLLACVYIGLALVGARTPGPADDGAALLRAAAAQSLGALGVIIFAAIVILACLTTVVGLLAAWAGYAYAAWPAVPFNRQLLGGTALSMLLANLGLGAILTIVSPLTLLLYPMTISLVVVTLLDALAPGHLRAAYTWPVAVAGVLGAVSALEDIGWSAPSDLLARSGGWSASTGWILPALIALGIGLAIDLSRGRWSTPGDPAPAPTGHRRRRQPRPARPSIPPRSGA